MDNDTISCIYDNNENIEWDGTDEDVDDPLADFIEPEVELVEETNFDKDHLINCSEFDQDNANTVYDCDNNNEEDFHLKRKKKKVKIVPVSGGENGCAEILPGVQGKSLIFHDGEGYYYRTNRKSQSLRYLRCIKIGCKARGQISDILGSPLILTNNTHNHRSYTPEEQVVKRNKAFKRYNRPPKKKMDSCKKMNCYIKNKDGSYELVTLDTSKIPDDAFIRGSKPVDPTNIEDDIDLGESNKIKENIEKSQDAIRNILLADEPRVPEISNSIVVVSNNCTFPASVTTTSTITTTATSSVTTTTSSTRALRNSSRNGKVPLKYAEKRLTIDMRNPTFRKMSATQRERVESYAKTLKPILPRVPPSDIPTASNEVEKGEEKVEQLINGGKDLVRNMNIVKSPRLIKKLCATPSENTHMSEVLCDAKNIPAFYHDGNGHFYTLSLFRNNVRYLNCIKSSCRTKAKMFSFENAPIVVLNNHNHSPLKTDEQFKLKDKIAQSSFSNLEKEKESLLEESDFNDATSGNPLDILDEEHREGDVSDSCEIILNDSPSKSLDDVIVIKQEPQETCAIEEMSSLMSVIRSEDNDTESIVPDICETRLTNIPKNIMGSNVVTVKEELQDEFYDESNEEVDDNDSSVVSDTIDHNIEIVSIENGSIQPNEDSEAITVKVEPMDHTEDDSDEFIVADDAVDKEFCEELFIKEEQQTVDEYLSMTVDNDSDNDNNLDEITDCLASSDDLPSPVVSPVLVKNEIPNAQSMSTIRVGKVFGAKNNKSPKQNVLLAPKPKLEKPAPIAPVQQTQPENIQYFGFPPGVPNTAMQQFQTNIPSPHIVQFTPESSGNQGVQFFQLGQNGGFIQYPGQNIQPQPNPFGYFVPQLLQMPQQPLQNNPCLQLVNAATPDGQNAGQPVISQTPQTVTVQQNGQIYQFIQKGQDNKVVNAPQPLQVPQIMQTVTLPDGSVYQIVQNNAMSSSTSFPNNQIVQSNPGIATNQIVQNTSGISANIVQNSPNISTNQIIQSSPNNIAAQNTFTQTLPTIQHNGQMYQLVPNNGSVNMTATQAIPSLPPNGPMYQMVQNNQQTSASSPTVTVQQNGQVFQLVQPNSEMKNKQNENVTTLNHNGQLYHVIQNEQTKNLTQNLQQTLQQKGQVYEIVSPANKQSGQVFQVVQNEQKNAVPRTILPIPQNGQTIKIEQVNQSKEVTSSNVPTIQHNGQTYQLVQSDQKRSDSPQTGNGTVKLSGNTFQIVKENSNVINTVDNQLSSPTNKNETGTDKTVQGTPHVQHNGEAFQLVPCDQSSNELDLRKGPIYELVSNGKKDTVKCPTFQLLLNNSDRHPVPKVLTNVKNGQVLKLIHGNNKKMINVTRKDPAKRTYAVTKVQNKKDKSVLLPSVVLQKLQYKRWAPATDGKKKQMCRILPKTRAQTNLTIYSTTSNTSNSAIIGPNGQTNIVISQNKTAASSQLESNLNEQDKTTTLQSPNGQIYKIIQSGQNKQMFHIVLANEANPNSNNNDVKFNPYPNGIESSTTDSNPSSVLTSTINTITTSSNNNAIATVTLPVSTSSTSSAASANIITSISPNQITQIPANVVPNSFSPMLPGIQAGTNLPILPATISSPSGHQQIASFTNFLKISSPNVTALKTRKQFKPIAPAPSPKVDEDSLKNERRGAAISRPPSPLTRDKCQVTPSEELPGLPDVIYHDGKGYYYYFQKMKYKNRSSPNDQKLLRCIKDSCRAVASMTVGELNSPIRHGLWYHNHDPLTEQEQTERRERLLAIDRMKNSANNNKDVDYSILLKRESKIYVEAVKKAGFEPLTELLEDDEICFVYGPERRKYNEFVRNLNNLMFSKDKREEKEGTIAMSVKKRPRSTVNTKPLVDDPDDGPTPSTSVYDNDDDYDDGDDDYNNDYNSTSTQPQPPVKKRGRGRPRKRKKDNVPEEDIGVPESPPCTSFQEIKLENIKSELFETEEME